MSFAGAKLIPFISKGNDLDREACKLLGKFGQAARIAIPMLKNWLKGTGEDEYDRDRNSLLAAETLWKIEGNAEYLLPRLAELLDSEGGFDEEIPDLVYQIGPSAEPLASRMAKILHGEHYDPAWAAANALEKIASKDPQIIRSLVDALGQKSSIVSDAAMRALVATGSVVIPYLISALKEKDGAPLAWIVDALSQFGEASAEAIPEIRKYLHDEDVDLRTWSIIAVAKIGVDPSHIPDLITILATADGDNYRKCAAEALMKLGSAAAPALSALRSNLTHESEFVRNAAERAIFAIESATQSNP